MNSRSKSALIRLATTLAGATSFWKILLPRSFQMCQIVYTDTATSRLFCTVNQNYVSNQMFPSNKICFHLVQFVSKIYSGGWLLKSSRSLVRILQEESRSSLHGLLTRVDYGICSAKRTSSLPSKELVHVHMQCTFNARLFYYLKKQIWLDMQNRLK